MARFLFASWEGGGHVQPLLLVARGLMARGHQVLAVSDACNAPDAAALGLPFRPWITAPSRPDKSPDGDPLKDWLARSPFEIIGDLSERIMCGPAARYARDTVEIAEAFDADVVTCHELMFGVMAGAEAASRRFAPFSSNLWSLPTLSPEAAPFGIGVPPATDDEYRVVHARLRQATRAAFQQGLPAFNEARVGVGLAPLDNLFEQLDAADRVLIGSSRAFDFDVPLPAAYRYVGPYFADPAWAEPWTPPWSEPLGRPLVLVSFSTMYQAQDDILRRVIEALGRLPVQGLVTLGPMLSPESFAAPSNVCIVRSAPHSQLYPKCAAVITHAGHGTALRPLIDGAPLLCIPFGRDQPDNAVRATERGAALRLTPSASTDEIEAAVRRLIDEPGFARSARALGARIRADADARSAEDELESLAALGRRPVAAAVTR